MGAWPENTSAAGWSGSWLPGGTSSNATERKRRPPAGRKSGNAWSGARGSCTRSRRSRRSSPELTCSLRVAIDTKESGEGYVKALKLSKEAKDKLTKLEELSDKAADGDKKARGELRRLLRESGSEVVREASELARIGQWALIKTAARGEALAEEALVIRLDMMRSEIAGPDPSPLEVLLAEKIVSAWMLTEVLELFLSAQLTALPKSQRMSHSVLKFYLGWQERAHRRLLSSIRELARVRRLQSGVLNSQTNVQINLSKPEGG